MKAKTRGLGLAWVCLCLLAGCDKTPSTPEGTLSAPPAVTADTDLDKLRSCKVQVDQALDEVNHLAELNDGITASLAQTGQQDELASMADSLDSAGSSLAEISDQNLSKNPKEGEVQSTISSNITELQDVLFVLREFGETLDALKVTDKTKSLKGDMTASLEASLDATLGALKALGGKDEAEMDNSTEPEATKPKSAK